MGIHTGAPSVRTHHAPATAGIVTSRRSHVDLDVSASPRLPEPCSPARCSSRERVSDARLVPSPRTWPLTPPRRRVSKPRRSRPTPAPRTRSALGPHGRTPRSAATGRCPLRGLPAAHAERCDDRGDGRASAHRRSVDGELRSSATADTTTSPTATGDASTLPRLLHMSSAHELQQRRSDQHGHSPHDHAHPRRPGLGPCRDACATSTIHPAAATTPMRVSEYPPIDQSEHLRRPDRDHRQAVHDQLGRTGPIMSVERAVVAGDHDPSRGERGHHRGSTKGSAAHGWPPTSASGADRTTWRTRRWPTRWPRPQ